MSQLDGRPDLQHKKTPDHPEVHPILGDRSESSEQHSDFAGKPRLSVLLVGTLGGGGIDHYVRNLEARLTPSFVTEIYDMCSDPKGSGLRWFIWSILRSMNAVVRYPFRPPPDIVHIHTSHALSFYRAVPYVLISASLWRRPVILHIHGSSFDSFLSEGSRIRHTVQKMVFNQCSRIIVLSDYWNDVLDTRVDDDQLVTIPNAVDSGAYQPTYPSEQRVVFVSSLVERKGIREFTEAIKRLLDEEQRDVKVTIAGSGEYSSAVQSLADAYDAVEYRGFISEREKVELLSDGSIFVLPTYAEGLPIALLEGMAGGNAVITTPVGGIPEVVDEHGAILVDSGDISGLKDALVSLLENPERVESMARTNRARIEESFDWDMVVKEVMEVYLSVFTTADSGENYIGREKVTADRSDTTG